MGRKKDELLRAKTCKHAKAITKLRGLFVKETCKNKAVIKVPTKNLIGCLSKKSKQSYLLMAKHCNTCEFYERSKHGKKIV